MMRILKYLVACGTGLMLVSGCGSEQQEVKEIPKVAVEVEPAHNGDLTITKTFSGTLEGAKQSIVYATIPERVVSIPVSEGSFIKKGQPIIKLDKNGSASKYNQARAVYLYAKENYEKMSRLYEQKAISEMNYNKAGMAFEVAKSDFAAATATVELSVPIDGIVTDISVNLGDQAPLGIPIATVANTKEMRLTVFLPLKDVEKLTVGEVADINIYSNAPISAKIIEVSRSADPNTRLFRVELEMNNPNDLLKPGMYAGARIVIDNFRDILLVSNRAIFSEEGIFKIYVVENGMAYTRTIEIGASDGVKTQILSGLEIGEQVVVVGKSALRDETPVILPKEEYENVSG
ncbi:MAG: efflux RND transporter periplasmic adaptor subunit [candidate division Zixibacteria bacterium]|nr:efflux RND transporter periplasmic adaptor subunit [candidate division Zixibacteria bacterium]